MKKGEKVRSSTESTQPYPIGHQPLASHPTLMSTRGALHEQTAALDRRWQRAVPAGKKINSPSPTRGQIEQENKPNRRSPPLRQPRHTGVGGVTPQRRLAANAARRRHHRGAAVKARGTPHRVSATATKVPHTGREGGGGDAPLPRHQAGGAPGYRGAFPSCRPGLLTCLPQQDERRRPPTTRRNAADAVARWEPQPQPWRRKTVDRGYPSRMPQRTEPTSSGVKPPRVLPASRQRQLPPVRSVGGTFTARSTQRRQPAARVGQRGEGGVGNLRSRQRVSPSSLQRRIGASPPQQCNCSHTPNHKSRCPCRRPTLHRHRCF